MFFRRAARGTAPVCPAGDKRHPQGEYGSTYKFVEKEL